MHRLRLSNQWECLKCIGHGPSVLCVEWPLVQALQQFNLFQPTTMWQKAQPHFQTHTHPHMHIHISSLRFKIKVTFGEISLKLHQMNWNVARNNVNVVVDELPSQITIYTYLTINNWTRRRRRTSTRSCVWDQSVSIVNGDERVCCLQRIHEHS